MRNVAEYIYGDAKDLVVLVIDSERLGVRSGTKPHHQFSHTTRDGHREPSENHV